MGRAECSPFWTVHDVYVLFYIVLQFLTKIIRDVLGKGSVIE